MIYKRRARFAPIHGRRIYMRRFMSNFKKLPKYIRCACIVILTLPSAIVAYYIVGYTYYLVAWLFLPGDYYVYAKDCEIYATGRITRSLQVFKEEDGILYFIDNYGFWTLDCVTDNIKMFNSTLTNEDIQELQTVQPLIVKEKGFDTDLKEPKDKNDIYLVMRHKKRWYEDRLTIVNHIEELSEDAQRVYGELERKEGDGVIVCPQPRAADPYGFFFQPVDYMIGWWKRGCVKSFV